MATKGYERRLEHITLQPYIFAHEGEPGQEGSGHEGSGRQGFDQEVRGKGQQAGRGRTSPTWGGRDATGKLSEALEWIERARGSLYEFHQKSGHADLLLGGAADDLEAAGHGGLADQLREELVGRNVVEGRWTFQIVEEYDDTYWSPVREFERMVRDELLAGAATRVRVRDERTSPHQGSPTPRDPPHRMTQSRSQLRV